MLMTAFINRSSNIRPDNITPNKLFYPFIKDVYLTRQTKMVEWMENIEKAISKIMADKVYTSAEFKRERDNFHVRFLSLLPPCRASGASSFQNNWFFKTAQARFIW